MKKIITALLTILVFSQLPPAGGAAESDSVDAMYIMASLYEKDGNLDDAFDTYQKILKIKKDPVIFEKMAMVEEQRGNSDSAHSYLMQGTKAFPDDAGLLFKLGAYNASKAAEMTPGADRSRLLLEAQSNLSRAAKLDPTPQHLVLLAMVASQTGDNKTALNAYNTLIDGQKLTEYYSYRGVLKIDTGDTEGGMADLKTAADLGDVIAMIRLADIYRDKGDNDTAMGYLLSASKLRPDLGMPDMYLGEMYRDKNDYEQSVHFFLQAAANMGEPVRTAMLKEVGRMALEREDFVTAAQAYKDALENTTDDSRLYYLAGYAASQAGDEKQALDIFMEGLAHFPEYTMLRIRAAVTLLVLDKPDEAESVLDGIDPVERDLQYYLLLSRAHAEQKQIEKAISVLNDGLKEYPDSIDLLLELAFRYESQNNYNKTVETLKHILKIDPDSTVAQNFLGYLYTVENKNLDEAEILINSALQKDPDNYAYQDSKAWLLYRKGKYQEAYNILKNAIEKNPADPEMNEHMNAIRKKLGIKE